MRIVRRIDADGQTGHCGAQWRRGRSRGFTGAGLRHPDCQPARARIGLTFTRVGLHPDWGGAYFLPRLIGSALAAELVFTGGMINAKRAERLGLVNRVVPADDLEATVRGLAGQIAGGPPHVIADAKRTLRRSLAADLDEILEMEAAAQVRAFENPAFAEGIRAFMEKRAPRFGG